jgi:hypothetical protein
MKRNITLATAMLLLLVVITPARADSAEDAYNHGRNTAAFELTCSGTLVTDAELRARLDGQYRAVGSPWREDFLTGFRSGMFAYDAGWRERLRGQRQSVPCRDYGGTRRLDGDGG